MFAGPTVRENLLLGATRGCDPTGFGRVLEMFPRLGIRLSRTDGTLSGGERKMLAIGRALLGQALGCQASRRPVR